jgi:hypothetical protein
MHWFSIDSIVRFRYGLGFIGNLLSLIVFFSQDEFRNVSTGVLFLTMTISNTIHLWTLITEFLISFNVSVYSSNVFVECRLNYFVQNVSRAVSTYTATGITIDRLIRSEMPVRSRLICTRRNAIKLSIICLITLSILFSFWFCPFNTVNPTTGTCYAGGPRAYTYFFANIYLPVRLILVCIVPIIVMSVANVRLLLNIQQSRRRVHPGMANQNAAPAHRRFAVTDRMLFLMMLTNVLTFIITQFPFHIYTIIQFMYSIVDALDNLLIRGLLLIWSSMYFGIGFYLYCLASPLFREKLGRIKHKIINSIRRHH